MNPTLYNTVALFINKCIGILDIGIIFAFIVCACGIAFIIVVFYFWIFWDIIIHNAIINHRCSLCEFCIEKNQWHWPSTITIHCQPISTQEVNERVQRLSQPSVGNE